MPRSKFVRITKSSNSKSRIRRMRSRKKRKSDTLQQIIGNQAAGRLIQAKLSIGKLDDKYEREADHVADKVMRMPEPATTENEEAAVQAKPIASQITPLVQRAPAETTDEDESLVQTMPEEVPDPDEEEPLQTKLSIQRQINEDDEEQIQAKTDSGSRAYIQRQMEAGEEEETLQTKYLHTNQSPGNRIHIQPKAVRPGASPASSAVATSVNALKGGGRALPQPTRTFFQQRFGSDFSQVRVHTDSRAANTAKSINARAFTFGRNIAFGKGQYVPESPTGKRLLGHELTHVVQQSAVHKQVGLNVNLAVQRAPKTPLKDRKTREVIDTGIAPVIDNVLKQSDFLRPYIKSKLTAGRKITGQFNVVSRGHFKDLYIAHAISRGAKQSKAKKEEPGVAGFYDPNQDRIIMRQGAANVGGALHEAIHFFAEHGFRKYFTGPVDEGVTQFYTNFVLSEFGLKDSSAYPDEYLNGVSLVSIVGRETLGKAYFVPGYAKTLFKVLSEMYVENHKGEWLRYLGKRDFVALSGIPHKPRPED